MKDVLRPNRAIGLAQLCVFIAMGGVGVLLVRTSFTHAFLVAQFLIGAIGIAFAVRCVIAIIEDLSVLLDRNGIEKLRLFMPENSSLGNV
jgi:cobalamin biosynthesis protein CobD/CbiB